MLRWSLLFAGAAFLIFSILPEIVWNELGGGAPPWLAWAKLALLGAYLLLSVVSAAFRPLWRFIAVLIALQALDLLWLRLGGGLFFQPYLCWLRSPPLKISSPASSSNSGSASIQ